MTLFRMAAWLVLPVLLITCRVTYAHPGHENAPDLRVWKDKDGLFEIEATFVLARDDKVQLCKHDGTMVWIPLDKLSQADRSWVKNRVEAIRKLNGGSSDPESVAAPTTSPTSGGSQPPDAVIAIAAVFTLASLAAAFRFLSRRRAAILSVTSTLLIGALTLFAVGKEEKPVPPIQKHFEAFKEKLKFRSDKEFFYVESTGIPDHPMMVGITSWQQQVPIPQPYTGRNAWRIPLHPKLADKPISAKTALYRGAIALAVNGVPIFNALNNRGDDTYLAGELDEYGGHCGRADDYHYHIAPVHLEKTVGKGNPIGYALDGFPLYGYTDAEGKEPKDLDEFNGRMEKDGYRYYSTKKYPYINGGMRGVVTVKDDQIDPQPRANPIRPDGRPLRGAKITGFVRDDAKKTYTLQYELSGHTHFVRYTINDNGTYDFVFSDGSGKETKATYRSRRPEGRDDRPPPRPEERSFAKPAQAGKFTLTSPAFEAGGNYPIEFTGDGAGVSPPLTWSGAPEGTKYYALQLWHKPFPDGDEVKSYWVITNIPARVTHLEKNTKGVGKDGYNDKNRTGYDPMKSKGPGVKQYHITLYALSAEPKFTRDKVTRADLLAAIKDITLTESTLSYKYERSAKRDEDQPPPKPGDPPRRPEGDRPPPPRYELGQLFPPNVRERLKLTAEQEKQVAELEKEVRERLGKILTAEQKKQGEAPPPPRDR